MPKKSYIIGGVIIVLAIVMAAYSFKSTLTAYVTVSEAKETGRRVQVAGIAVTGTERYDIKTNNFVFTLREDGGDKMVVQYDGPRPGNFDDATKVVATGQYKPEKRAFVAKELLVRCPTNYDGRVIGE